MNGLDTKDICIKDTKTDDEKRSLDRDHDDPVTKMYFQLLNYIKAVGKTASWASVPNTVFLGMTIIFVELQKEYQNLL